MTRSWGGSDGHAAGGLFRSWPFWAAILLLLVSQGLYLGLSLSALDKLHLESRQAVERILLDDLARRHGERSLAELGRDFQAPGPPPSRTLREAVGRRAPGNPGPHPAAGAVAVHRRGVVSGGNPPGPPDTRLARRGGPAAGGRRRAGVCFIVGHFSIQRSSTPAIFGFGRSYHA